MDNSIDTILPPAPTDISTIMGKVEDMVREAAAANDPSVVFEEIAFLRRDTQLKGVVIARLLSDLWEAWPALKGVDISFNGFVEAATAETGLAARTIKPYIRMWKAIFNNKKVPAGARDTLLSLPVGTLLYLQPAVDDDMLTTKRWHEIEECATPAEVKAKVREWRGGRTSSETAVRIMLGNDGRLKARRGTKGNYKAIGYLDMKNEDEVVRIALHRIITAAGIVEMD